MENMMFTSFHTSETLPNTVDDSVRFEYNGVSNVDPTYRVVHEFFIALTPPTCPSLPSTSGFPPAILSKFLPRFPTYLGFPSYGKTFLFFGP